MQTALPLEVDSHQRSHEKHSGCGSITKCDLLFLLGFAMGIISQGRSFISRLLDLSKMVNKLRDLIKLDKGCRSELCDNLEWHFLQGSYRNISFTDTVPSIGFGGFYKHEWFADV